MMKLRSVKPIYHEGTVRTEGTVFETLEQHGRELIKKGYAEAIAGESTTVPNEPNEPNEPTVPTEPTVPNEPEKPKQLKAAKGKAK